ncbi:MAG: hypothetical protein ABI183_00435 [Polyangiaceae bacterium]
MRSSSLLFALAIFTALGCSHRAKGSDDAGVSSSLQTADVTVPVLAPIDGGAPSSVPTTTYEDETSTRPMEVLKFQFTSAIDQRKPTDKMVLATPGDRVYAYLTLRNRSGRKRSVHLEFSVNGDKRTEMDLDVAESWSYRTWGYNTILPKDKTGKLTLSVTDDAGNPILDESLPIVKKQTGK